MLAVLYNTVICLDDFLIRKESIGTTVRQFSGRARDFQTFFFSQNIFLSSDLQPSHVICILDISVINGTD